MNIRRAMAHEIAEQIGAAVLPECCTCGWPLMEKPDQGMPFCWGCVTDRRCASDGRARLLKAKLAAQGVVIQESHPTPEPRREDGESSWPEGWAM